MTVSRSEKVSPSAFPLPWPTVSWCLSQNNIFYVDSYNKGDKDDNMNMTPITKSWCWKIGWWCFYRLRSSNLCMLGSRCWAHGHLRAGFVLGEENNCYNPISISFEILYIGIFGMGQTCRNCCVFSVNFLWFAGLKISLWDGSSRSGLGAIGGSDTRLTQDGDAVHVDDDDDGDGDDFSESHDDDGYDSYDDANDDWCYNDDNLCRRRPLWAQSLWHSSLSICACKDVPRLPEVWL